MERIIVDTNIFVAAGFNPRSHAARILDAVREYNADMLIIGDLNAYAMEDPIMAIVDAGYTNLIEAFNEGGYSYVFNQPTTQEGIDQCMEALEGCPVEAIGEDGDED